MAVTVNGERERERERVECAKGQKATRDLLIKKLSDSAASA